MAKNNRLINQLRIRAEMNKMDAINAAADKIIPEIYAALALALHNVYGFGYERINATFAESQRIWTEFQGNIGEMMELCERETGIIIKGGEPNGE